MKTPDTGQKLPQFRSTALIAVGSNKGLGPDSPTSTIDSALHHLSDKAGVIRAVSTYYETPCFPPGAGPDYVNAAFALSTNLTEPEILRALHKTETAFGRTRTERWGQRTMDLDLIAVGQSIAPDHNTVETWINLPLQDQRKIAPNELILPHPRVQDRAFVLVPLCDIAPDWVHPVLEQTAQQMLARLPAADRASIKPIAHRPVWPQNRL